MIHDAQINQVVTATWPFQAMLNWWFEVWNARRKHGHLGSITWGKETLIWNILKLIPSRQNWAWKAIHHGISKRSRQLKYVFQLSWQLMHFFRAVTLSNRIAWHMFIMQSAACLTYLSSIDSETPIPSHRPSFPPRKLIYDALFGVYVPRGLRQTASVPSRTLARYCSKHWPGTGTKIQAPQWSGHSASIQNTHNW